MEHQTIAEPIKPFLTNGNTLYFKHPITHDIYTMQADNNTAYDLINGMPLPGRWLCSEVQFNQFKNLFITEN
jgi:hypothetical protein